MVSKVELIVLINVKIGVLWLIFNKINVFNLFVLINVVKVVVLMIKIKVVWIFEIMIGNVMGSFIFSKCFILDILNVIVVFLIDGLILVRLMYVFWKIGSKV